MTSTINRLISGDPFFDLNQILHRGSYLLSIQEFQKLGSILNQQSLSDKVGLILNDSSTFFPQIYGPLANYSGVNPVISNIDFNYAVYLNNFLFKQKLHFEDAKNR